MNGSSEPFMARLKRALLGDRAAPLVLVGNFDVEDRWAQGELGLPVVGFSTGSAVVNRMDEFALLLADGTDHVLLKEPPDPDFLAYLSGLGVTLPGVLCPSHQDPRRVVTADVLADDSVLARLRDLGPSGAHLLPHGVSDLEEELSRACGLRLAGSPSSVCKRVNSKTYSRKAAASLGLRQPQGWTAETVSEWDTAARHARRVLEAGGRVAAKDAYGVSGRGILQIADASRLDHLTRMIHRRAERTDDDRLALVLETWVGKRTDLNYQVTVGRDGGIHVDFVKEAITVGGVHKGHRFPPDLTAAQYEDLYRAGELLGRRLAADGYCGVAGVDALVGDDGGIFPVIEINARNNMSTYQVRLDETVVTAGQRVMARQYPLRLTAPVPFKTIHALLKDLLLPPEPGGDGIVVNNFATVNAAAHSRSKDTFDGRLHALLVAGSHSRLNAIDEEVARRLGTLTEGTKE